MPTDLVALQLAKSHASRLTGIYNVRDYGAVGDGTTDDTVAIQAACDAAFAAGSAWSSGVGRPSPRVFAQGIFKTTATITIKSAADFTQAVFWAYQTTGVVVQVGDTASELRDTTIRLPQVFSKIKTTTGWSQVSGTTGVRVSNLYNCDVYVNHITWFETGFWGHANGVQGSSYNVFHMNYIYGCKVGIKLAPNTTGSTATSSWFNTNLFFGGSFAMAGSEGTSISGSRQILISDSTWPVDDNKFYGMSLETNNSVEYMIECYGMYNIWEHCRFENTGTAKVLWRASSNNNIITKGINTGSIEFTTESGAYNFGTATPLATYATVSRPGSLGVSGIAADSTLGRPIYSSDGILIKPLAFQEEPGFTGSGSPEAVVTAVPGALYTRTDSGTRTNLCVQPISSTVATASKWAAVGGTGSVGAGYYRNTLLASAGATTRSITQTNATNSFAVSGGIAYTFSCQARMSIGLPLHMTVQYYTSGAVATGSLSVGATVTPSTSAFGDMPKVTATSPSDAAYAYVAIAIVSGPANSASDTLDIRRMMIEANNASGAYIDGALSSGGGVTYAWTGSADASTSTAVYSTQPISYVKTGSGNTGWVALAPAPATSVAADATDLATAVTLVNDLKNALIASGIVS